MSDNQPLRPGRPDEGGSHPGSPPKDRLRISNEVSPRGGLILPVHRSSDYVVLSPHTVVTGLVGEGPVPRVSLRLLRQDKRAEHLEQHPGVRGRYYPLERLAYVEMAEVEIDLAQAARLVDALVAMLGQLPPELLNVFGITMPDAADDAPAPDPEWPAAPGGSVP